MAKAKNMMLAGPRYKLGAVGPKTQKIAPAWVHLGVAGSGILLGYVTYPYVQGSPLAMTLMGAAGSIAAVGILLLVYDFVREKSIVETMA